jgi:hypothetical protein
MAMSTTTMSSTPNITTLGALPPLSRSFMSSMSVSPETDLRTMLTTIPMMDAARA